MYDAWKWHWHWGVKHAPSFGTELQKMKLSCEIPVILALSEKQQLFKNLESVKKNSDFFEISAWDYLMTIVLSFIFCTFFTWKILLRVKCLRRPTQISCMINRVLKFSISGQFEAELGPADPFLTRLAPFSQAERKWLSDQNQKALLSAAKLDKKRGMIEW